MRRLIDRGITVCVFVQEPRNWLCDEERLDPQAAYSLREFGLAIRTLESWGIHVNLRKAIHIKFAVIDEAILWEGSLNILSHANTKEHMRRWDSESETRAAVDKHSLASCSKCEENQGRYGADVEPPEGFVTLGKLLANRRAGQQLSQRALARSCGLRHSRISQIEAGRNITLNSLFQIMHALGLRILVVPELYVPSASRFLRQMDERESP